MYVELYFMVTRAICKAEFYGNLDPHILSSKLKVRSNTHEIRCKNSLYTLNYIHTHLA